MSDRGAAADHESRPTWLSKGLMLASCWAVAFESWILLVQLARAEFAMPRSARLFRTIETAGFAASAALGLAVILVVLPGLRRWVATDRTALLSCSGFASCAWLTWVFVAAGPDLATVRLTTDPILLRSADMLIATLVVIPATLIIFLGVRRHASLGQRRAIEIVPVSLALLGCVALLVPGFSGSSRSIGPDLFLFSVDTLRADHLGCYGYEQPASPTLDRFCEEAVVFERAMAPAPSTMPSYASIMTGLWPKEHGVYSNHRKVDHSFQTLAERLRDRGYMTAALLDGSYPGTFPNLGQGFEFVVQRGITAATLLPSPAEGVRTLYYALLSAISKRFNWGISLTTISAVRRLSEFPTEQALFVHFYWPFPHAPYDPPRRFLREIPVPKNSSRKADLIRRYDAEVRFADAQVGRLFEKLESLRRYRDAWIIFTADHGEELGRLVPDPAGDTKQFFGHSRYLFDASVRVPLIVRAPDSENIDARREPNVVSTVSIAATLLGAADVEFEDRLAGPLPLKTASKLPGYVVSVARSSILPIDVVSIRTRDWRLIETRRPSPMLELYREGNDAISDNVAADYPEIAADLLKTLHGWDRPSDIGREPPESLGLSKRERESLEALGYLF